MHATTPYSTLEAYLSLHEHKSLRRFITCGSVDDGKSTLIGRLLYDTQQLFDDQLATLAVESKKYGTQNGELDFALLVDGLSAEREQGITIDVAYRFFNTEKCKFIVADTPGHEQYTRNMVTGASTADAAVLLVDACYGLTDQTRRHSFIVTLLGIDHIILAINKMDLVNYDEKIFQRIEADYRLFARQLGLTAIDTIPLSALRGDNITTRSTAMRWYSGPTLLEQLENLPEKKEDPLHAPLRMPVQYVNRPNSHFRGFSGTLLSGTLRTNDKIRVLPSGVDACVKDIIVWQSTLSHAIAGQPITLVLDREVDISRGDIIVAAEDAVDIADQFQAHIVWMHEDPLLVGRHYLLKSGTQTVSASVTDIKYQININTLEHLAAKTLPLNGIAVCNLKVDRPIPYDPYTRNRVMGSFILIDRQHNGTVAAGMIDFALRRSNNIHFYPTTIGKAERAGIKGQKPCVLWFTGLSGAGKSTIANALEKQLHLQGFHTYLLDGDNVRYGLNKDLGFTDADRVENIRRIAEMAKLMVDAGLIVLTAFISPFRAERDMARRLFQQGEFFEFFIDTPLALAEARDPKGLYKKARRGEIKNFTGVDSDYEAPLRPDRIIHTDAQTPEAIAVDIISWLHTHHHI